MFMVLEGSTADIILGCPWMSQHQPQVNWNMGEILKWSEILFHELVFSLVFKVPALNSQTKYSPT